MFKWYKQAIKLHAGGESNFLIDCESLTNEDLASVAGLVATTYSFREVIGIPNGGLKFADALRPYCKSESQIVLIVDDVLTTGVSMREFRQKLIGNGMYWRNIRGLALFVRDESSRPLWVQGVFTLWAGKPLRKEGFCLHSRHR